MWGGKCELYLYWLLRHWVYWSSCTNLEFIQNHVTKTLIEDNADIYIRCKLLTSNPRIHGFVAVVVVACGKKLLPKIVNSGIFL